MPTVHNHAGTRTVWRPRECAATATENPTCTRITRTNQAVAAIAAQLEPGANSSNLCMRLQGGADQPAFDGHTSFGQPSPPQPTAGLSRRKPLSRAILQAPSITRPNCMTPSWHPGAADRVSAFALGRLERVRSRSASAGAALVGYCVLSDGHLTFRERGLEAALSCAKTRWRDARNRRPRPRSTHLLVG